MGNCPQLNQALDVCLQVAPTDLSVLIVGESGVGKEVLPRIIHDNSKRSRGRFFAINCGSIPEGTIDSELFGHEKGAFTSAIGESEGYFGIANGGTLFLDEVGELPLATQARLLRVLETGEYIRVGGQEVRKTDVRIVAATNVNMQRAISEGRFREDLYYRLNIIPVAMPPLRDRGYDIVLLFRLFAMTMKEKYTQIQPITLTPEAERLLMKYKWPGNIRQLKNITQRLALLTPSPTITPEILLQYIPDDEETMAIVPSASSEGKKMDSSERDFLIQAILELQKGYRKLNQDIINLQQQVLELGGKPHPSRQPLALPSAPACLTNKMEEPDDDSFVEEIKDNDFASLNVHSNELEAIRKALEKHNGNRRKAAEELGISERTLFRKIKQL